MRVIYFDNEKMTISSIFNRVTITHIKDKIYDTSKRLRHRANNDSKT